MEQTTQRLPPCSKILNRDDNTLTSLPPCSKILNRDDNCLSFQMPFQVLNNNVNSLSTKHSSCSNSNNNCGTNNSVNIKSEPQDQFPSMQCNNHGMPLPGGLSFECFMTIKQEPPHVPCSSTSPLACNQQNQPTTNQYKFSFNCMQQTHQNLNSCQHPQQQEQQKQQQSFMNNANYFCQMPPTPPNSQPGSPANPTQQLFPTGFLNDSVLRGPPPPYDFAIATGNNQAPLASVPNGTPTIKYNRKNNPDLERRRVHFCHYPGTLMNFNLLGGVFQNSLNPCLRL